MVFVQKTEVEETYSTDFLESLLAALPHCKQSSFS